MTKIVIVAGIFLSAVLPINSFAGEHIQFPPGHGFINVADSGVVGDGKTDCSTRLREILTSSTLYYFPKGTYIITLPIKWPKGQRYTQIVGESREETIFKVPDNSPWFADTASPKGVFWTSCGAAVHFRNAFRNFTIHIGKGNPGASGIMHMGNNVSDVRDVTIIAEEGSGLYGLDMAWCAQNGPAFVKNVHVIGFEQGVRVGDVVNSITMEHIKVENQRNCGVFIWGQVTNIRGLTSINSTPAVNLCGPAQLTLVEANLHGKGIAADTCAIIRRRQTTKDVPEMFLRDVATSGYREVVNQYNRYPKVQGPVVTEHHDTSFSLFPTPDESLRLPIKETPEVAWDLPADWAVVRDEKEYGGDVTDELQKAIDSGKKSILIYPARPYVKISKNIYVRGNVRRIFFGTTLIANGKVTPAAEFIISDEGTAPVVVIDGANFGKMVVRTGKRSVVFRNVGEFNLMSDPASSADLFFENVTGLVAHFGKQNIFMRQCNPENLGSHGPSLNLNGTTLWLLGLKKEKNSTAVHLKGNAWAEVLGFLQFTTYDFSRNKAYYPMFINDNSSLCFIMREQCYKEAGGYKTIVEEKRDGQARTLSSSQCWHTTGGSQVPFYAGYKQPYDGKLPHVNAHMHENTAALQSPAVRPHKVYAITKQHARRFPSSSQAAVYTIHGRKAKLKSGGILPKAHSSQVYIISNTIQ